LPFILLLKLLRVSSLNYYTTILIERQEIPPMHITQKSINELYNHYKGSAKSRSIPFRLTKVDFHELSFPLTCPILGIPLRFNTGKNMTDDSYSLDRIDSSKGYTKENVIVVSNRANILKRDATLEELQMMAKFYAELDSSGV
jgi:hypothetical protein